MTLGVADLLDEGDLVHFIAGMFDVIQKHLSFVNLHFIAFVELLYTVHNQHSLRLSLNPIHNDQIIIIMSLYLIEHLPPPL